MSHDYLWQVLKRFNFPDALITTISSLYNGAQTEVMINGFLSNPYTVTRGVRQGDPLSCLLFDLAIEPLAAAMRNSALKGFPIPKKPDLEVLIATLFADDTTVYLTENDDFSQLQQILDSWCYASRAKFNIQKTEILPIGTKEYRDNVIKTHTLNPNSPLPKEIAITCDGNAIRVLGGWIGNQIKSQAHWLKVIDNIDERLNRWESSKPTMEGRRLIIFMVIGGTTQYLAKVQGMPKNIEQRLQKRITKFLWNDKYPTVNIHKMHAPIDEGGRGILDLVSRNEAIAIMWLKSYLNFGPNRATWTYFADEIISQNISNSSIIPEEKVWLNIFLQSWITLKSKLPHHLQTIINAADKNDLQLEGIAFSRSIICSMPIWYHKNADAN